VAQLARELVEAGRAQGIGDEELLELVKEAQR
jgi:hypothetical protein